MQTRLVCVFVELPIITNYIRRKRWQDQFENDVTIIPIYNTGRSLLQGSLQDDAITYYDPAKPWQWILYSDFQEPKYILANKNFLSEKATKLDMIGIQHLGHDDTGTVRVLTMSSPRDSLPYCIQIPPKHILFLAVRKGIIVSRLRVYQHLSCKIRSWNDRLPWIRRYIFSPKQIKRTQYC